MGRALARARRRTSLVWLVGALGSTPACSEAGSGAGPSAACPPPPADFVAPERLSQTGLYAEGASGALASGVYEYRPQYELWADGATKRRFAYLPPCTTIDSSDMDFWTYPQGMKLWKDFVRNDGAGRPVRVETRLIEKYSATKWFMTAFLWDAEQTDAFVRADDNQDVMVLEENASGTEHDVPGRGACAECHDGMWDKVLGFSALQLSGASEPGFLNLDGLVARELLSAAPAAPLVLPGSEVQAQALGYLHANCGQCHNPNAKDAALGLEFWQRAAELSAVEGTALYLSTVNQSTRSPEKPIGEPEFRVVPGNRSESAVYWRMTQPPVYPSVPQGGTHMPLIGSEVTDTAGVDLVGAFIDAL